ncbi:mechanosensitive ion channel protein 8-like [Salvia miltiorrhiza]|uniref:mechanosensitive ion channel protein 8-like n=1 Tax=Salvia miltiorrhiza TaxID=226208 RepID=UPI0025AC3547|nr:mechanosensitive ion channel protein 8-like [Salvia miltiorrhiza]
METLHRSNKSLQPQREEERQILLSEMPSAAAAAATKTPSSSSSTPSPPKDAEIKINGETVSVSSSSNDASGTNRMWRDSSYDFSKDAVMRPATSSKEFDFATESPASQQSPLSRIPESPAANNTYGQLTPREIRVSFNETVGNRRSNAEEERDEVLLCSSNNSFRRKSSFVRSKTKSRLLDQPEEFPTRSQTPRAPPKSQFLGKGTASEIDEDDPFLEEDLPEDYRSFKFSIVSILQLLSLIIIVAALACSLAIDVLKRKKIFQLDLWKWELMVLVLISGRLLSGWVIRIIVFCIERNFLLRKRVLYFVYGLRNAVQNCVWLGLVLIAWQCIFDKKVERVTNGHILPYVTKIWVCLLVGTLIWLLKTLLVKVLASSFHVSTFFDRIQESLFNQYVIETLSGPPLIEIELEQEEEDRVMVEVQKLQSAGATIPPELKANMFPKSGRLIGTPTPTGGSAKSPSFSKLVAKEEEHNGITIEHLHRLNQKNISAWNMKRLTNIVRKGVLSTLDEKIQGATADEDDTTVPITSENQAKLAAKKIFFNVAKPGFKYIYLEDIMRFMRKDEAIKAIRLFEDECEHKGISKRALKNWVVNAFRERRALALSLNDTKTAVDKLHHMLNALVAILIIIIWLLILKVATTHFFIFLSSQLLLVVFMFGNTCKTTFEAIIFLFVMHPFDVGDRIEVDGVQMVVEEMNILTTVFLKFDNHKIYYPNSVLAAKPIHNYYRSPDMGDAIDFSIHIATPCDKIATMKERITRYVDNRSEHWYPAPMIVMRDMEDMNRLKFSVWLSHKMNFQDMGERWIRRSLLVEEMVKIFRELDIEYRMLPVDVNVRNMPPTSSSRVPSNWTAISA